MSEAQNYPRLTNIVSLDKIPEELNFLHNGLTSFFDKLYYQRYLVTHGLDGTTNFYVELVSLKGISKSFGGFRLVFCPDTPGNITVFPVSISYN